MKTRRLANTQKTLTAATAVVALTLAGCLGESNVKHKDGDASSADLEEARRQAGTTVRFDHMSHYSIVNPNPETGCAGDTKIYRHFLNLDTTTHQPEAFPEESSTTGRTAKPKFIRNVSVDLTDSNTPSSYNGAYSCSYGTGGAFAPPNQCATFDYGALGGVGTTLAGSLILIGGMDNWNYSAWGATGVTPWFTSNSHRGMSLSCGLTAGSNVNSCAGGFFALGVDRLPAAAAGTDLAPGLTSGSTSGAISSWVNMGAVAALDSSAIVPEGAAGSSLAYSQAQGKLILFGGASPFTPVDSYGTGSDNADTWIFDVKNQTWSKPNPIPYAGTAMTEFKDSFLADPSPTASFIPANTITLDPPNTQSHIPAGRSLFGFVSVPRMALSAMTANGDGDAQALDTTDRVVITGGLTTNAVLRGSFRFNPTFAPDFVDLLQFSNTNTPKTGAGSATIYGTQASLTASNAVQFLNNYHTQLLSSNVPQSVLSACFNSGATCLNLNPDSIANQDYGIPIFGFGAVPVVRDTANQIIGTFATLGGFILSSADLQSVYPDNGTNHGPILLARRPAATTTVDDVTRTGNVSLLPAHPETGHVLAPIQIQEYSVTDSPLMGGMAVVEGMDRAAAEVVTVGGDKCADYLVNASGSCILPGGDGTDITSVRLTLDTPVEGGGAPPAATILTNPPQRVGMAAARGYDGVGNKLILAWGGMSAPVTMPTTTAEIAKVFILPEATATTWSTITSTGTVPPPLANAAMVYSHVTDKYYLYGGYNTSLNTMGDTYELTVTGDCTGAACTMEWRKLDASAGLTCYPSCPGMRRSHRMVEVNYDNQFPNAETLPSACTPNAPCSFGIFMQGGTYDGTSVLGDRWMFDPTANNGGGHWQRVDGFPPRHLAAMSTVEYTPMGSSTKVSRAILFGGETGLANPKGSSYVFVPPTLGDTYMYDFANNTWQRVQLLGKGYVNPATATFGSSFESRQAYDADVDAGMVTANAYNREQLQALTPPPLAGAIMVTRTMSGPQNSVSPGHSLPIPEVYLFGGRTKEGKFHGLGTVYKFCAGTTGEKPFSLITTEIFSSDDASCDAFDETIVNGELSNANSTGPVSNYVGRWLKKHHISVQDGAGTNAQAYGSYLGAGTYDSYHDKIVLFGGITPTPFAGLDVSTIRVTSQLGTLTPWASSSQDVLEYTPPSKNEITGTNMVTDTGWNGNWAVVPTCSGSSNPGSRYGHALHFDNSSRKVIVVGGYDLVNSPGALLTQTQTDQYGNTFSTPDVWTGQRIGSALELPAGLPTQPQYPCYAWEQKTTFGNTTQYLTKAPPTTGLAHAASVFIPGGGYNTGFYLAQDPLCVGAGPVAGDSSSSRLYAGGAYIDLNRSEMGPHENAVLNLTFIPLGPENQRPDGTTLGSNETAQIKIHLIHSGVTEDNMLASIQPRYLKYFNNTAYPKVVHTLSVVGSRTGQLQQEQVFLPLSMDDGIDRIRIERVSGSLILIDATIVRLGYR